MPQQLYEAQAHVAGGREQGHGRTSDGALDVAIREPVELGGDGAGTNPEQLFAVGFAACFASAVRLAAHRQRIRSAECEIDSRVALVETDDKRYEIAVRLDVQIAGVDDDAAVALVRAADALCPYSNATRGNVEVALRANGTPV